jgi:hypothetical protein
MTNKDLIQDFIFNFTGKEFRQVNNLSYRVYKDNKEYVILYSYSTPIAVKIGNFFILNNHKYSITTSIHQSMLKTFLITYQKEFIDLNFRLLYSAGCPPETINIINIEYKDYDKFRDSIYYVLFNKDKDYFLYGIDNGLKTKYRDFICKLPSPVNTIAEALSLLNPIPIEERQNVKRQGEFFFQPIGNSKELKKLINEKYRDKLIFEKKLTNIGKYSLSTMFFEEDKNFRKQNHIPSYFIVLKDGLIFARGDVKHKFREHRVLHLGKTWHRIFRNTAIQSWTVNNNSD